MKVQREDSLLQLNYWQSIDEEKKASLEPWLHMPSIHSSILAELGEHERTDMYRALHVVLGPACL